MNWRSLLHFLRRVVPSGHEEAEELLKIYAYVLKMAEEQEAA
jgi:hypothetical protein